jgi:hypothetical protein
VVAYAEEALTAKTDPVMQEAQKQRDEQKNNTQTQGEK